MGSLRFRLIHLLIFFFTFESSVCVFIWYGFLFWSHIEITKKNIGQVIPLLSLWASYIASLVLVGHFITLTIILGPTFNIHGKISSCQLFVYKTPFSLKLYNYWKKSNNYMPKYLSSIDYHFMPSISNWESTVWAKM